MQQGSISSATRLTGLSQGQSVTLAALTATVTYGFTDKGATASGLTASNGMAVPVGTPVTLRVSKGCDLWAISATGTAVVLVG